MYSCYNQNPFYNNCYNGLPSANYYNEPMYNCNNRGYWGYNNPNGTDDAFFILNKSMQRANSPIPMFNYTETVFAAQNSFNNPREMYRTIDINKDGSVDDVELNSFAIFADKDFDGSFDAYDIDRASKELNTQEGRNTLKNIYNLNKQRANLLKTNPYSEKIDVLEGKIKDTLGNGYINSPEMNSFWNTQVGATNVGGVFREIITGMADIGRQKCYNSYDNGYYNHGYHYDYKGMPDPRPWDNFHNFYS